MKGKGFFASQLKKAHPEELGNYLNQKEGLRFLQCTYKTLAKEIQRGTIQRKEFGGLFWISKDELKKMKARLQKEKEEGKSLPFRLEKQEAEFLLCLIEKSDKREAWGKLEKKLHTFKRKTTEQKREAPLPGGRASRNTTTRKKAGKK